MQAVRTSVSCSETVSTSRHSTMVDLDVGLCGSYEARVYSSVGAGVIEVRALWSGCLRTRHKFLVFTCVCPEQKMALSHVFSIFDSSNFALRHLAQIMCSEFALVTRLVANLSSTKVIIRHSL